MKYIRGQFNCARMMRICAGLPAVIFCLLLSIGRTADCQSTFGSVRGTVQDTTGGAMPGTQVILHSVDENTEKTVSADASGSFLFENVKAGKYSLRAHHDGFSDTVVSGITVEARQDVRLAE